jgi:hypothetical protein
LVEDLLFELAQLIRGLETEVFSEHDSSSLKGAQGIGLSPRPIQRKHEVGMHALEIGMLGDYRFQFAN